MAPQLVFGTGVIGMDGTAFQDAGSVGELLLTLNELGVNHLDTAARYPPLDPGKSEELLGSYYALGADFVVDTKVYSEVGDGSGDLTGLAIHKSVDGSLTRLHRLHRPQGINVLYAHRPDPATPLEEQIQGFEEQITKGHAKAWGVANHSPETLEKIISLCERHGWQKPSWYQGTYNLLTRGMETRVLPILRAHNMSFLASHALASGFLTGKHVDADGKALGRFGDSGNAYAAPEIAAAMKKFVADCKSYNLSPVEVASRWNVYHSALGDHDGIVLGASKLVQVRHTVEDIRKGPLPDSLVKQVNEVWDLVKPVRGQMI